MHGYAVFGVVVGFVGIGCVGGQGGAEVAVGLGHGGSFGDGLKRVVAIGSLKRAGWRFCVFRQPWAGLQAVDAFKPIAQTAYGIALAQQIVLPCACAALPVVKVGEQRVPMLAALGGG